MHTPSLITPAVAAAVMQDHARAAGLRRSRGRIRTRSRGRYASRILAPRGRILSPSAH